MLQLLHNKDKNQYIKEKKKWKEIFLNQKK